MLIIYSIRLVSFRGAEYEKMVKTKISTMHLLPSNQTLMLMFLSNGFKRNFNFESQTCMIRLRRKRTRKVAGLFQKNGKRIKQSIKGGFTEIMMRTEQMTIIWSTKHQSTPQKNTQSGMKS